MDKPIISHDVALLLLALNDYVQSVPEDRREVFLGWLVSELRRNAEFVPEADPETLVGAVREIWGRKAN